MVLVVAPVVAVYPGGGTSPASVTGGPPQWSDASDATYATASAVGLDAGKYVGGDLLADGTLDGTALTLDVRLEFEATSAGFLRSVLIHWFIGEDDAGVTSFAGVALLGGIVDLSAEVHPLDFNPGYSLAGFCSAITAGTASVRALCGGSGSAGVTNTMTIYELSLEGPEAVEARPLRLYPRDDGLGMSSAPRMYPPTKARRVYGGYR